MRLLPREEKFYHLFHRQVEVIAEAARLLLDGMRSGRSRMETSATEITALEHKGDEVIHDIVNRLNQTFITPIDPEDIHAIASALDNVLDGIEDTSHRIVAYRIDPIPPNMVTLAEMVAACAKEMQAAVTALEKNGGTQQHCIEINRLENEADRIGRSAVADLFNNETDPIRIIKLKEVFDYLEATVDSCEDVADVLQNVVVKNS